MDENTDKKTPEQVMDAEVAAVVDGLGDCCSESFGSSQYEEAKKAQELLRRLAPLAKLGAWMIEQIGYEDSPWCCWASSEADDIAEKAVALGCPGIERVPYNPEEHGDHIEADPGDMIWLFKRE